MDKLGLLVGQIRCRRIRILIVFFVLACDNYADQFKIIPVPLKWSYLVIPILHEDNLGSIGKPIQKATKSYFMKISQFQCLLGQNCRSIEAQQSGLGSPVDVLVDA